VVRVSDLESGDYWKHMGMRTLVDEDGKTQVIMEVIDNLKQFYGNVHGGVFAGLLDSAMAVAVNQQLEPGEGASTVELKLNYLRAANKGTLRGSGQVIQKGRKIIVAQGEIKNDEGQLLAFGTATFMIIQVAQK